jgi:hypothetical protein
MDSKFGLRNAREQSRARKKILLTEHSEGNVMDVQGFVKLFGGDGVIRAGVKAFRGEKLPWVICCASLLQTLTGYSIEFTS